MQSAAGLVQVLNVCKSVAIRVGICPVPARSWYLRLLANASCRQWPAARGNEERAALSSTAQPRSPVPRGWRRGGGPCPADLCHARVAQFMKPCPPLPAHCSSPHHRPSSVAAHPAPTPIKSHVAISSVALRRSRASLSHPLVTRPSPIPHTNPNASHTLPTRTFAPPDVRHLCRSQSAAAPAMASLLTHSSSAGSYRRHITRETSP